MTTLDDVLPRGEIDSDFAGSLIVGRKVDFRSPSVFAHRAVAAGYADSYLEVLKATRTVHIACCECNEFDDDMGDENAPHWHVRSKATPTTEPAWQA